MMDWTKKLLEYAPDIAGAIFSGGATLPALAIKAIKDATGQDAKNIDDVKSIIENATPEQQLQITNANNSFKLEMQKLSNDLAANELADTQNAREHHKHSKMPAIICIGLTLMVAVAGYLLMTVSIPTPNKEIAYLLFGTLLAKWGDSIAYWVGTTRSSAQKTIQASIEKG